LLEQGHDVTHFNRSQTHGLTPTVHTIAGDRRNTGEFLARMEAAGQWDAVIDMVCYRPEEAQTLLKVFRQRAGQIIVCSTIDVYAKPAARYPITEQEPHGPLNDYAKNKSACEEILLGASDAVLPVTIIRACHVYGPGSAHRGHVVGRRQNDVSRPLAQGQTGYRAWRWKFILDIMSFR
jgi:nucleoside-diphosphate-sugar epimerase